MKICNPPSPPFRKGGMGGFESYFLCNPKSQALNLIWFRASTNIQINFNYQCPKLLVIGIWLLGIIWDLEFGIWNFSIINESYIP